MRRILSCLGAIAPLVVAVPTASGGATLDRELVDVFTSPAAVTHAPGDLDRLFVVELGGRIMVHRDGVTLAEPFLDLSTLVSLERAGSISVGRACAVLKSYERPPLTEAISRSIATLRAALRRSSGAASATADCARQRTASNENASNAIANRNQRIFRP